MGAVADNLARVKEAIAEAAARVDRDPDSVRLIAVSKTKPVALIEEAIAAGQLDFGENYAQELRDKLTLVSAPGLCWHFIGGLQTNKVKYLAGKVGLIHSVDGLKLAREIDKRSAGQDVVSKVLVEVNMGNEYSKSGVAQAQTLALVKEIEALAHVEVVGLMAMPPFVDDPEESRPYFQQLRQLRDRIRNELGDAAALPELSMGLSNDFEVAIEEGATMVRVGTAIFGSR